MNPYVAGRLFLILNMLLDDSSASAAEGAIHLSYSMSLTPEIARWVTATGTATFGAAINGQVTAANNKANVSGTFHPRTINTIRELLTSTFNNTAAAAARWGTLSGQVQTDFRDRHIAILKPAHRAAFVHHETTGILLPLSASTDHFTEPNRYVNSVLITYRLHEP